MRVEMNQKVFFLKNNLVNENFQNTLFFFSENLIVFSQLSEPDKQGKTMKNKENRKSS